MKKLFSKICTFFKKTGEWFKKVLKGPSELLTAGRPLAIVTLALLTTVFTYNFFTNALNKIIFKPVVMLGTAVIVVAGTELAILVIRLLIAKVKRSRIYFLAAWIMIGMCMVFAGQANSVPLPLLISFAATLVFDLLARVIWGFYKTLRFKQVFGYLCALISFVGIVAFVILMTNDDFGPDTVEKYVAQGEKDFESAKEIPGFEEYKGEGKYAVMTFDYGPDEDEDIVTETVDMSSYAEREGITKFIMDRFFRSELSEAPIAGRIWYPSGKKNCPALFIVHGNHDYDVPSYLGYDYLAEYLASNGYVVVSIDENIVNGLGNENDARALMVLENIKALLKEREKENSLAYELIDPDKIVIAGHSRGGECVSTAYLFNDLDACPDNGNNRFNYHFNISGVIAIAPVCDQYMPADHAVKIEDVNYLLLHGANDQDVSSMMGEKQYNNVNFTGHKDCFKSYVYLMGANHGQFNTQWGRYDWSDCVKWFLNTAHFIEAEEQQEIAKVYIRAFLDKTLLGDDTYSDIFYNNDKYKKHLPKTVYITDYIDSECETLFSFDKDTDIVKGDKEGCKVTCYGVDCFKERVYNYGGSSTDQEYLLDANWKEDSSPIIKFTIPTTDFNEKNISFAMADSSEDEENVDAFWYKVELFDENANKVSVENPTTVYSSLGVIMTKLEAIFGGCTFKHERQRVILTKDMFSGDSSFDYSKVNAITITFDGSKEGGVLIDDVCVRDLY